MLWPKLLWRSTVQPNDLAPLSMVVNRKWIKHLALKSNKCKHFRQCLAVYFIAANTNTDLRWNVLKVLAQEPPKFSDYVTIHVREGERQTFRNERLIRIKRRLRERKWTCEGWCEGSKSKCAYEIELVWILENGEWEQKTFLEINFIHFTFHEKIFDIIIWWLTF